MHLCHEEIFALLSILPGLSYLVTWLRSKFKHVTCCKPELVKPKVTVIEDMDITHIGITSTGLELGGYIRREK